MNILSVDWDFFFPPSEDYDWGHMETGFFLTELAWNIRAYNTPITSKKDKDKYAINHYVADKDRLKNFWKRVCPFYNEVGALFITDSHQDLYHVLQKYPGVVWNFDAHHDYGYGPMAVNTKLDCGNWVYKARGKRRITDYHLVYPLWRRQRKEDRVDSNPHRYIVSTHYFDLNWKNPMVFDIVFICRSSAWTPSWSDADWVKFIGFWKRDKDLWKKKVTLPPILQARKYDDDQAKIFHQGVLKNATSH